jgi:hypothetical protein
MDGNSASAGALTSVPTAAADRCRNCQDRLIIRRELRLAVDVVELTGLDCEAIRIKPSTVSLRRMEKTIPTLAGLDDEGRPNTFDYLCALFWFSSRPQKEIVLNQAVAWSFLLVIDRMSNVFRVGHVAPKKVP